MKALLIIAPKNFRDEELFETKKELEKAGISTCIASTVKATITGMLGGTTKPELLLEEVNVRDYDVIVFVGGNGAAIYFNNSIALSIAKQAFKQGKVLGAICIAPSILANAGLLHGKNATSFPSEKNNLISHNVNFKEASVVIDGRIVTASGPQAANDFGKALVKVLKEIQ